MGMLSRFVGTYTHNLDAKGRIAVPTVFRALLGETCFATIGIDSCIIIYTEEGWNAEYERLSKLPPNKQDSRDLKRMFTAYTKECPFDAQGRILLHSQLLEYGNIFDEDGKIKKECAIIGFGEHVEIWSADEWDKLTKMALPKRGEVSEQSSESN